MSLALLGQDKLELGREVGRPVRLDEDVAAAGGNVAGRLDLGLIVCGLDKGDDELADSI